MTEFKKEILDKLNKHEKLEEWEIENLVIENKVDEEVNDRGRWEDYMFTVVKLGDKYFGINWNRGLTENQEDSFMDVPYEVEKRTETKTITVDKWYKK